MRDKIVIMEKGAYKTAKATSKKKEKKKKKNREKRIERAADFEVKPIMLRWPYLWTLPLDHATFWICCSYYTSILTARGIGRNTIHLTEIIIEHFLKKKKEMHLQGSLVAGRFLSLPPLDHTHSWI
jgi:hypothetical protein